MVRCLCLLLAVGELESSVRENSSQNLRKLVTSTHLLTDRQDENGNMVQALYNRGNACVLKSDCQTDRYLVYLSKL